MLQVDQDALAQPSVLAEMRHRPFVSGVLRVTVADPLDLTRTGPQTAFVRCPISATLYVALYAHELIARGKEPHEQTADAAYVPRPLRAFDVHPLAAGAVILVERAARREPLQRLLVDDGYQRRVRRFSIEDAVGVLALIASFLELAGVPRHPSGSQAVERAFAGVRRTVSCWRAGHAASADAAGTRTSAASRGSGVHRIPGALDDASPPPLKTLAGR